MKIKHRTSKVNLMCKTRSKYLNTIGSGAEGDNIGEKREEIWSPAPSAIVYLFPFSPSFGPLGHHPFLNKSINSLMMISA